jgi:hypothetical protein
MNATEALNLATTRVHACFLCGAQAEYIGVFLPNDPDRWGPPHDPPEAGKQRGYYYGVCGRCMRRGDVAELAERKLADMRTGAN